jgi:hypothetical protein
VNNVKFKVTNEYKKIDENLVVNPKSKEIGSLEQYIDVNGNYQERIDSLSFKVNLPTSFKEWKSRYNEVFNKDETLTIQKDEKLPIGTSWYGFGCLSYFTVEMIVQKYGMKLYVVSDGGHSAGLTGVEEEFIEEFLTYTSFYEQDKVFDDEEDED